MHDRVLFSNLTASEVQNQISLFEESCRSSETDTLLGDLSVVRGSGGLIVDDGGCVINRPFYRSMATEIAFYYWIRCYVVNKKPALNVVVG